MVRCVDGAFLYYLLDRGGKIAEVGDCVWFISASVAGLGPRAEAS